MRAVGEPGRCCIRNERVDAHALREAAMAERSKRRCTGQVKTLVVFIVFFLTITIVQLFFALYANSNALLVDCASMLVDTLTYAGNLVTACARERPAAAAARDALATSCASILVLYGITAWGLYDAIKDLVSEDLEDDLEPGVVLAFGVFGFVLDLFAVFAFRRFGDDDAALAEDEGRAEEEGLALTPVRGAPADDDGGDGMAAARKSADEMNMCSALSHVLADGIRSLTSIVLGLVALYTHLNGSRADAYATLIVTSTVLFGSTALASDWCRVAAEVYAARRAAPPNDGSASPLFRASPKAASPKGSGFEMVPVARAAECAPRTPPPRRRLSSADADDAPAPPPDRGGLV